MLDGVSHGRGCGRHRPRAQRFHSHGGAPGAQPRRVVIAQGEILWADVGGPVGSARGGGGNELPSWRHPIAGLTLLWQFMAVCAMVIGGERHGLNERIRP